MTNNKGYIYKPKNDRCKSWWGGQQVSQAEVKSLSPPPGKSRLPLDHDMFLLLNCCVISKATASLLPASCSLSIPRGLHLTLSKLSALHLKEYVIGIKGRVGGGAWGQSNQGS